jgi:lipopolysaccharide transport system permease protein
MMVEYEIKPAGKFSVNFREIWDFKELFYFFTWRDIKVKYKQTMLGFLWAILQPAIMMAIFTFLFKDLVNDQIKIKVPYPVFVYTGLMFWLIFSTGLQNAGNSMVNNANIIKKIYFPRLIIPLSSILVALFDFLMTIILYAILLIYYQVDVSWLRLFVCFPLALLITLVTTFGVGSFLAALNVKYRDFRYIIPFIVQALMFLTPVILPVNGIKYSWLQIILNLNPLSSAMVLARSVIDPSPLDPIQILIGVLLSFFWLILGIIYFQKTESYFADLA